MNAFDQGRMAYLCDATEDDNPYAFVGRLYAARQWHMGWIAERADCAEVKAEAHAQS